MASPLITPRLLRQLEQFQLLARRRSKSALKGERRSRARGLSVEFADYRNYVAGDDFRYLDWNLYGRLERLFLKLYEEERELPVAIFLDASESMSFGQPRKFDFARQAAAAVGYVALCGFDRVTVSVFPEKPDETAIYPELRAVRGRKSALRFFHNLERLRAEGAADLNSSLRRGALSARSAGLAVVVSDFLDPTGYEAGLGALLGRGFQISALQILAPEEIAPTRYGDLRLVDAETGATEEVTFGRHRLSGYRQTVERFRQRLREVCQSRGIHFFSVASDCPLEKLLLEQLREAALWG